MKKLAGIIFFDSFILLMLGLVIVMSASSTYSDLKFDSLFHLFNSHLFKVFIGLLCMAVFSAIPYEIYKDYSKIAIIFTTFLLVITLFVATNLKGAGRWIDLGFATFQPADLAKLVLIIHLAQMIEDKKQYIGNFKYGFMYMFFWVLVISGLILVQPNISNGIIIILIAIAMLFVGGAKKRHIFSSLIFTAFCGGAVAMLFPHSRSRIVTFVSHLLHGGDINLQVKQAILGLGSGGIFGVGVGHSMQSNLFLPEAYGDFIFAILGEELGFIGSIVVLASYLIIFVAGIVIAKKVKDTFGQLLAFGITFSIALDAFVNIAVATGTVPTTGLPLPFISYGGTSLIIMCSSVGILINIATRATKSELSYAGVDEKKTKFKEVQANQNE
jgi:cell division protein FtsW